jgi:hypothetical protein
MVRDANLRNPQQNGYTAREEPGVSDVIVETDARAIAARFYPIVGRGEAVGLINRKSLT